MFGMRSEKMDDNSKTGARQRLHAGGSAGRHEHSQVKCSDKPLKVRESTDEGGLLRHSTVVWRKIFFVRVALTPDQLIFQTFNRPVSSVLPVGRPAAGRC
jgi:hypothetical protein